MTPVIVPGRHRYKAEAGFRKRFMLFAVIVLSVVIYTVVWYIMAGRVQEQVIASLHESQQYGMTARCENLHRTGYPLRIAMACDTLAWSMPQHGISFVSNLFVAGAPVYAPHWISLDITAPVTLRLPGIRPLKGYWKRLRLEADLDSRRPDRIALAVDQLLIDGIKATGLQQQIAADFIRLDADQDGVALNIRLSFEKLLLPAVQLKKGKKMPALDGMVEFRLDNAAGFSAAAGSLPVNWIRGHSGTLSKAMLRLGTGGQLAVSGPFTISGDGVLSGRFTVGISDSNAMMRTVRLLFPEQADNLETVFFVLNSMSKNEKGEPQLVFDIDKGKVRMGFIRLGYIPPLRQDY